MQQRNAGEEYRCRANCGTKANGGFCFAAGKRWQIENKVKGTRKENERSEIE